MKTIQLFLLSFCTTTVFATAALAQQLQIEQSAMLFVESAAMPKKAKACSNRIPGFASRYEKVFSTWHKFHQQRLAEGEMFLRSDAEKNNIPFQKSIDEITNIYAQLLEKTPLSLLEKNCDAMLEQLAESAKE